jgi:hypothetical protein
VRPVTFTTPAVVLLLPLLWQNTWLKRPPAQSGVIQTRTMPAAVPVRVSVVLLPLGTMVYHTSLGTCEGEQAGRLMPFCRLVLAPLLVPLMELLPSTTAPQGSSLPGR